MNVIIMGPPGCGKGTQATNIVNDWQVVHISTGDMLRAAVKSGSELGKRVEKILAAGDLVSDDLMMDLIRDRLQQDDSQNGWLLDGFPRTVPQAEGLVSLLTEIGQPVDAVVSLEVPDEEIVTRLSGRLTCRECGNTTNRASLAPAAGDTCPKCNAQALYQRDDDKEETIRNRLQVYREKTYPAAATLGERYPLKRVEGLGTPDEVSRRIKSALEEAAH
jgi:adenylate kinase